MDDVILDWATVECSKLISPENTGLKSEEKYRVNTYKIAIDVTDTSEQNFECPVCGEELSLQIVTKRNMSQALKKKIVREKHKDSWGSLKIFAGVSVVLMAAALARPFVDSITATAINALVVLVFFLIWLPGLALMIRAAWLLGDESRILRNYEKKFHETVTLNSIGGNGTSIHRISALPRIRVKEVETYGLS